MLRRGERQIASCSSRMAILAVDGLCAASSAGRQRVSRWRTASHVASASRTQGCTGCENGHVMCKGCLRFGLRVVVGDTSMVKGLLCGCLTLKDTVALQNLAGHADDSLKALMENPP